MVFHGLAQRQEAVLGLCRQRRLGEAVRALLSCNPSSVPPLIYSSVLQLCTDLMAEKEGRSVHELISISAAKNDPYLATKLVIFYEEAFNTFVLMKRDGWKANQFAYSSVLKACAEMESAVNGHQIHAQISKSRFSENPFVETALVDFHAKWGRIEHARRLFDETKNKDLTSWNSMISGYVFRRLDHPAIHLFKSFLRHGHHPDHFTFASVAKACSRLRDASMVNQIHAILAKTGFQHHILAVGSVIDAYAKCKNTQTARLLYDSLPEKDLISSTALISSGEDPVELFAMINRAGLGADNVLLSASISACADLLSLSSGRQIHAFIFKKLPRNDTAVGNSLIDMYAKSGEIEEARRVFEEMPVRNVISWTSMITASGRHGKGEEALAMVKEMEREGCGANEVTFLAAMSACGHAGLVEEGRRLFQSMVVDHGLSPRSEHFACLVDLLARGGKLEEACEVVGKMGVACLGWSSLWGALLGGCGVHGEVGLGEMVAARLFHLEPGRWVNCVVLSNLYASARLWEDARRIREMIRETGRPRKSCGYSLLHSLRKRETAPLLGYTQHFN
ncbi:pentatricopeptide repeat-containing protein At3g20730-like isoform X2 [Wolffia australiana]